MEENFINFVKEVGLPSGLVLVLLYIIYKVSLNIIDKVIVPLKDSHIDFMNSLKLTLEQLVNSQTNLTETVNTISKAISLLDKRKE